MSSLIKRHEIFQPLQLAPEKINPQIRAQTDCLLLLSGYSTEGEKTYMHMGRFISHIQKVARTSYDPLEEFPFQNSGMTRRLDSMASQLFLHNQLNSSGFDFANSMPFKLQTWDQALQKWGQLTIDYQIAAACYLSFLAKNPTSVFVDTMHEKVKLDFKTRAVHKPNGDLDHIEVMPMLRIHHGHQEVQTEYLLLTLDSREISFPSLKFTSPFKMEVWDIASLDWHPLTIEHQIMAACHLASLRQRPGGRFSDTAHPLKKLVLNQAMCNNRDGSLAYVEVTPALHITTPGRGTEIFHLRIVFNGNESDFSPARVVQPSSIMRHAPPFSCICMQEESDDLIFRTGCGHCFHHACIKPWLDGGNTTCPYCRGTVGAVAARLY